MKLKKISMRTLIISALAGLIYVTAAEIDCLSRDSNGACAICPDGQKCKSIRHCVEYENSKECRACELYFGLDEDKKCVVLGKKLAGL